VTRRFVRILVHVLVAAQVLLGAPVANAFVDDAPAAAHAGDSSGDAAGDPHCADLMADDSEAASCPCCPDGSTDMTSCFSHCLGTSAAMHSLAFMSAASDSVAPASPALIHPAALAEPPLKPPPIV
jgi:hypothetical protein